MPTIDPKGPADTLDYTVDWSKWLVTGDTVNSSQWIVPTGITKTADTFTTTSATIWVSGGTVGILYDVINRISTAGGRIQDQTLPIYCIQT